MIRALLHRSVALAAVAWLAACATPRATVRLTEDWPATIRSYGDVVEDWTRKSQLHVEFQEVCELVATLRSAEWRAAHAQHDADLRGLTGEARERQLAQSRADVAGPYELEVMLTTWDRRENDLDRGDKAVWHVVLVDDSGAEIAPLSVVRDRRPNDVISAEFPNFGDFATAYIVKFPKTVDVFRAEARVVKLRVWGTRGAVEVAWDRPQ